MSRPLSLRLALLTLGLAASAAAGACRFDAQGIDPRQADLSRRDQLLDRSSSDRILDARRDRLISEGPACDQGFYRCSQDLRSSATCVGLNEYAEERSCFQGCDPKTGNCRSFTAANQAAPLLHLGEGKWTVDSPIMVDTTRCTTDSFPSRARFLLQEEVCILRLHTLLVTEKGTLTAKGQYPFMVVASQDIVVEGSIIVSAHGQEAGPGGGRGGDSFADGVGCGGGPHSTIFQGGAGGSLGAIGGAGGGSVAARLPAGCTPGCPFALIGGSGGGGGSPIYVGGAGGGGGGALQLSAANTLSLGQKGAVVAGGGGGGGGGATGISSGGGGGSGGALLLEALQVTGKGIAAANGGGGGSGGTIGTQGGNGQNAGASLDPAAGGGGIQGCVGGAGSSRTIDNGLPGGAPVFGTGGGGGGGGAGRICLRTEGNVDLKGLAFSPGLAASGPGTRKDLIVQ